MTFTHTYTHTQLWHYVHFWKWLTLFSIVTEYEFNCKCSVHSVLNIPDSASCKSYYLIWFNLHQNFVIYWTTANVYCGNAHRKEIPLYKYPRFPQLPSIIPTVLTLFIGLSLSHLQHELSHLELFLQLLAGRHWCMVEQAEHLVVLQRFAVVLVVDVQHSVLAVIAGELQAFPRPGKSCQAQTHQHYQRGCPHGCHYTSTRVLISHAHRQNSHALRSGFLSKELKSKKKKKDRSNWKI